MFLRMFFFHKLFLLFKKMIGVPCPFELQKQVGDTLYPLRASVAARMGFVINAVQIVHHHFVEDEAVLTGGWQDGQALSLFSHSHDKFTHRVKGVGRRVWAWLLSSPVSHNRKGLTRSDKNR